MSRETKGDRGDEPPVCVLETADLGLLAVVRSLLDAHGVPHAVQGEEAARLGGLRYLSPFSERAYCARVLVPFGRAAEASELLGALTPLED